MNQKADFRFSLDKAPYNSYSTSALIIEQGPKEIILGIEFLNQQKCNLKFESYQVELNGYFIDITEKRLRNEKIENELINKNTCYAVFNKRILQFVENVEKNSPPVCSLKVQLHEIRLNEYKPFTKKPYQIPYKLLDDVNKEVERLKSLNIIQPSHSDFVSPAFPIVKRNKDIRLVVDYRHLNSLTITK